MVPGCEKNKGSILQRAIHYITKLQDEAKDMAARWDTANMTTNHAIAEISAQNAKLKGEVNRRGDIATKWMQRCRDAGLEFDDYDDEKDLGPLEVDETQD
jgi:bHLH factor